MPENKSNEQMAVDLDRLLAGQCVLRVGLEVSDGRIVIEFEGARILLLDQCRFQVTDLTVQ